MLYSLEFTNSFSFRDAQEFNLVRTAREEKLSAERWPESSWDHSISTVAAIFGANASGKSGLFRSLWRSIKDPAFKGGVTQATFRFRIDDDDPSTVFDLRFLAPDFTNPDESSCEYHYRYEVTPRGLVTCEELRFYPKKGGKSLRVFLRELTKAEEVAPGELELDYAYRWGAKYKGEKSFIERSTRADELFLANSALSPENALEPILAWLRDSVNFYAATNYEAEFPRIKRRLNEEPRLREKVLEFIRQADLGIIDVVVAQREKAQIESFRKSLEDMGTPPEVLKRSVENFTYALTFTHASSEGQFEFPDSHESDGTRAMLSFASVAIDALDRGGLLIIDEIDTSLHPLLVRDLVRQFNSPETNPKQAQLIFTSHDVTLLYSPAWMEPVLSRDQIWFVEKDMDGASSLFSVAEFPVRNDENIFRKYLAGQYGGVPHPRIQPSPDSEG